MSSQRVRPRNVLVLAPVMSEQKNAACYDLLTEQPPAEIDYLRIVYRNTPDQVLREWADNVGEPPGTTVIVGVTDRAQVAQGTEAVEATDAHVEVFTANPNDLTGMSMTLNNAFGELSKSDRDLYVCFDSITALLQFVDGDSAYRFLHMLTGKLRKLGAVAHFHASPEAHDPQTLSQLKTTFDDLVEHDG